jgi:hypothetical protein
MLKLPITQPASVQEGEPKQVFEDPFGNSHSLRRVLILIAVAWSFVLPTGARAGEPQAPPTSEREAWQGVESQNAYYQATYVWQRHGSFRASYTGPNSLSPNREKGYTFSATAYFGLRPWAGGELYVNPEVIQAVALSDLHGLGGLTNAENQKTAGPTPTLYRARLFLRQTLGFDGGKEPVESGANQLAGEGDRRRLVLTAGNLAVIDIFDANPYAHDPRLQFLNWSFYTHGAYDFAADARGYTWGAAVEYYHDNWVLRAGRFLEPFESNGLQLDYRIASHHGDQFEVEHAHEIGGQPGRIRLLGYRNLARMGGYRDALAFAAQNGGTPEVANVRKDQVKYGFGINVEQKLNGDIGLLARGSWNNGALEEYAFTEIDRSVTGGANVKGTRWGRPEDSVFLGIIRNGISAAHRDYLAAGGLGFFIGDGQINYRPEDIVEAMYVAKAAKGTWVALDFQRIRNPAYNADRGPVNVAGLRLHLEF